MSDELDDLEASDDYKNMPPAIPMYPEHDKLGRVSKQSQEIGQFIDWVIEEKEWELGEWGEDWQGHDAFNPVHFNIQELLAEYFEIDLKKVEQEKRAMLDSIRAGNRGL